MFNGMIGRFFANAMLEPLPQPFPWTPDDYGVSYRDVAFPTRDGLNLRGWLLNERAGKVAIMTHFGYRANRYGYQVKCQPRLTKPYKKEIEFVKVAKRLTDAGYAVLMYDLRNHGESDKTARGVGTGGVEEGLDVLAAVDFVASDPATAGKPIGLLSYCMGANSTLSAMAEDADTFVRANVKALVAVQPLRNGDFLKAYGVGKGACAAAEAHFKSKTGGISLNPPLQERAKSVMVPTRLVQGRRDPWTNLDFVMDVFENIPVEKEMFWLEELVHRFDGYNWMYDHPEVMLDWFESHLSPVPAAA